MHRHKDSLLIGILSLITTQAQIGQSRLCGEENKEVLATGLNQVIDVNRIYLVND